MTNAILGLNLLYLLVENRLSDFHCEVLYMVSVCNVITLNHDAIMDHDYCNAVRAVI